MPIEILIEFLKDVEPNYADRKFSKVSLELPPIPHVAIGAVDLLEYIKGKDGELLALIIRRGFSDEGVNFVTSPENFLQVGILNHQQGSKIKPHQHKEKPKTINYTQEVLHLEYGKVEAVFYQNNQAIKKCLLFEGDTIILLGGGHGFNILEDTKMIEIKQGPYLSQAEDKVLLEIKEEY